MVSVSDGRGGSDSIGLEIRVLDSLVTAPDQPTVERRVQVTADNSTINEGEEVTFVFTSLEAAPAGGLDVFYSLKQLAVDDDAEAYDFRPLPLLSTHHTAHVYHSGSKRQPDRQASDYILDHTSRRTVLLGQIIATALDRLPWPTLSTTWATPERTYDRVQPGGLLVRGTPRPVRGTDGHQYRCAAIRIDSRSMGDFRQNAQSLDVVRPMNTTFDQRSRPARGVGIFVRAGEMSGDFVRTRRTYPTQICGARYRKRDSHGPSISRQGTMTTVYRSELTIKFISVRGDAGTGSFVSRNSWSSYIPHICIYPSALGTAGTIYVRAGVRRPKVTFRR